MTLLVRHTVTMGGCYGKLHELEALVKKAREQGAEDSASVEVSYRRGTETTNDTWTITVSWNERQ